MTKLENGSTEEIKPYSLMEFEKDYHNVQEALRQALSHAEFIEEKIKLRPSEFPSWNDKFCTWLTYKGKISAMYHNFRNNK